MFQVKSNLYGITILTVVLFCGVGGLDEAEDVKNGCDMIFKVSQKIGRRGLEVEVALNTTYHKCIEFYKQNDLSFTSAPLNPQDPNFDLDSTSERLKIIGKHCTWQAEPGWTFDDGKSCRPIAWVCDGSHQNYPDKTDEALGCLLFPETGCKSVNGKKQVECKPSQKLKCNFQSNGCTNQDGSNQDDSDDSDDSDPKTAINEVKWWNLVLLVVSLLLFACSASFVIRIGKKYCLNLPSLTNKEDDHGPDDHWYHGDVEMSLQTQRPMPDFMKLINLLENTHNWRANYLQPSSELRGKQLYAQIHQDPEEFRNLFHYLVVLYPSHKRLKLVITQLFEWEGQFHRRQRYEVIKCWRLHLGSTMILKSATEALDPVSTASRLFDKYLVCKEWLKTWLKLKGRGEYFGKIY